MLWEVEIRPADGEVDREGLRVTHEAQALNTVTIQHVESARSFLLQGDTLTEADVRRAASSLLAAPVTEVFSVIRVSSPDLDSFLVALSGATHGDASLHVSLHPPGWFVGESEWLIAPHCPRCTSPT